MIIIPIYEGGTHGTENLFNLYKITQQAAEWDLNLGRPVPESVLSIFLPHCPSLQPSLLFSLPGRGKGPACIPGDTCAHCCPGSHLGTPTYQIGCPEVLAPCFGHRALGTDAWEEKPSVSTQILSSFQGREWEPAQDSDI